MQSAQVDQCLERLTLAVASFKQVVDSLALQQHSPAREHAQQAYLQHTNALREGLVALFQRKAEQEKAAAEALPPSAQELEGLRAKRAALQHSIRECCLTEKALIDQSRSLLDAMTCWEATRKQLS